PDERGVYGQLLFRTVTITDPGTGARVDRCGLYSVGTDRAKPFWPRPLGSLPILPILVLPDAPTLEKAISAAFQARMDGVKAVTQRLEHLKVPNRYDPATLRVFGQVKLDADEVLFWMRDPRTIFLE